MAEVALGLDLGLKTGALVLVSERAGRVYEIISLSTWLRGPRVNDSPTTIVKFFQEQVIHVIRDTDLALPGLPVGIDWTAMDAFMGGRSASVMKAFTAGYLYRFFLSGKTYPLFFPPSYVRVKMGLAKNAKKEVVQERFTAYLPSNLANIYETLNEHEKDAAILAYIAMKEREGVRGHDN